MLRSLRLLALATALHVPLPSHAQSAGAGADDVINSDRPGIADGSNVVGRGRIQVEAGIQHEYRPESSGHSRRLFVPALVRLGLDRDWEARIEGNTYSSMKTYDATSGVSRSEGAAPTSVGLKYHFIDSAGLQRPSVGAILRIFPPSGTVEFRNVHTTGDLRLAADWDFAPRWSFNPNLGVAAYEDADQRPYMAALFAATLNYNPTPNLNLFVDVGVQSQEAKRGRTSVICDIGVAYLIGRNVQVDVSAGWGASSAMPPRPFLASGISVRF